MAEVAAHAQVGRQTVSNAINSPELLRPETLARVRAAIDELGYRPHAAARSLRRRESRTLGYALEPSIAGRSNAVHDRFLHALTEAADAVGHRLLVFPAADAEQEIERYDQLLREQAVDAFVLDRTRTADPRHRWLHDNGVPFVAFGRSWGKEGFGDWVDVDGAAGTEAAAEHLAAAGHELIGLLGWPQDSDAGEDRAEGWRRALERRGLSLTGLRAAAVNSAEDARRAARVLLEREVTAIVALSDTLALGCYDVLRERGLRPGQDVAVTGFDDSPIAALLDPALSSVEQPLEQVAQDCVRLLLARLADPGRESEQLLLAPRLIVRQSSRPGARPGGILR
ncbi:LacI family transcriptional regulator [Kitasatospora sp. NBC_01250]|uniref:LacI family DNA-binding transcriptional regulator n=1 Tax=unclassified Kitasatospora TaxID=2633591 RepID=UPI002E1197FA|nr:MULTISPECIES: LacI family DNA-binding transcriptional regulator [unclassified Kitasatospora]WSJ70923.1 LacI family transcriptional regulator [Kitasatospora sp. NBC_01302]